MQGNNINNRVYINNRLLVIWWYIPLIYNVIYSFFSYSFLALIKYIVYAVLFFFTTKINDYKFNKKFVLFIFSFIIFLLFNILAIDYRYYAMVEAITELLIFITPFYIVSLNYIFIRDIIVYMHKYSIFFTLFSILAILFSMFNLYNWSYGRVSSVAVLNVIFLLYSTFYKHDKKKLTIICLIINIIAIAFFGSRMPLMATFIAFLYLYFNFNNISYLKKYISIVIFTILISIILINIKSILNSVAVIMNNYGLESRTINLLLNDLGNKSLIEMMMSSGREEIWPLAIDYILNNNGIPGGFGVMRNVTGGHIYFSHNLILDTFIMFGLLAIPLFSFISIKLKRLYSICDKNERIFISTIMIYFICTSMTGAHFLSDNYSVLFISLVLFYNNTSKV